MALIGAMIGISAAFGLTRLMSSLLYGTSATDPIVFATIPIAVLLVALVACAVPALWATRIDPIVALRYE